MHPVPVKDVKPTTTALDTTCLYHITYFSVSVGHNMVTKDLQAEWACYRIFLTYGLGNAKGNFCFAVTPFPSKERVPISHSKR